MITDLRCKAADQWGSLNYRPWCDILLRPLNDSLAGICIKDSPASFFAKSKNFMTFVLIQHPIYGCLLYVNISKCKVISTIRTNIGELFGKDPAAPDGKIPAVSAGS